MTLTDAFNSRSDGDYGIKKVFQKDDVEKMFEKMKTFITAVETLIHEPPEKD